MAEFGREIGVDKSYISRLESGRNENLGRDKVREIQDRFGVNPDWLLTGEGEALDPDPVRMADGRLMAASDHARLMDQTKREQAEHVEEVKKGVGGLIDAMRYVDEKRRARYLADLQEDLAKYAEWCAAAQAGALAVAGADQRAHDSGEREGKTGKAVTQ